MGELNRYLTIQEWMLALGLKPSELMAFALIYGFSQDGKSVYRGSSEYISYWLGLSDKATLTILRKLVKSGLIERKDRTVGCAIYADYKVSAKFIHEGRKYRRTKEVSSAVAVQESSPVTKEVSSVHNNSDKNIYKEKDMDIDLSLGIDMTETLQDKMRRYENA